MVGEGGHETTEYGQEARMDGMVERYETEGETRGLREGKDAHVITVIRTLLRRIVWQHGQCPAVRRSTVWQRREAWTVAANAATCAETRRGNATKRV